MTIRLQYAIDTPAALCVLPLVAEFVDLVEVGTPLLKRFGLAAITTVAELAPHTPIVVDSKTVDGAAQESAMLFAAGAAAITVLSCASNATITAAARAASDHCAYLVIDTITEPDPAAALARAYPPGVTHIALHTSTDARLAGDLQTTDAFTAIGHTSLSLVLAGGIDENTIAAAAGINPAVIVVGKAIAAASDPARLARSLKAALR